MSARESRSERLDHALAMLRALKGVKEAFFLTKVMEDGLTKIERSYPSLGPLAIKNDGVRECLRRQHLVCIIKDRHFRPPPVPTVVLMDEDGNIIGRELLPGEKLPAEKKRKVIRVGEDFVIFFEKGQGKGARFVLPPVPFKEVEELDGVCSVISSSPSTAGDFFLRQCAGLDDDPKLASVLIGFDLV